MFTNRDTYESRKVGSSCFHVVIFEYPMAVHSLTPYFDPKNIVWISE